MKLILLNISLKLSAVCLRVVETSGLDVDGEKESKTAPRLDFNIFIYPTYLSNTVYHSELK